MSKLLLLTQSVRIIFKFLSHMVGKEELKVKPLFILWTLLSLPKYDIAQPFSSSKILSCPHFLFIRCKISMMGLYDYVESLGLFFILKK